MTKLRNTNRASAFDVAIVGAGPAGLSAAATASTLGARVVVIDSAEQPGGQFWRHRSEAAGIVDKGELHHGWRDYLALRRVFDEGVETGAIRYLPSTSVWMAQRTSSASNAKQPHGARFTLRLAPSHGAGSSEPATVHASTLVLATGAYDRQLPVPGWHLPGVMAAGGIQAFAKQNGMLPGKRFVIAGTGPFLLSVAAGISHQGGSVAAVLESANLLGWLPRAHRAAGVPAKALEGIEYTATMLRHRIAYRPRTVITEIVGTDHVTGVRTARVRSTGEVVPGSERQFNGIDTVGLGWGFTPQMELPVQIGAATRQDVDGSLVAIVDEAQRSSVSGLFIAGELTGVGGAALAVLEGRVAGRTAALESAEQRADGSANLPRSSDFEALTFGPTPAESRAIARQRSFARAMHLAHPVPAGWQELVTDDTIVCRCEEVRAAALRESRETMAADDLRTQKGQNRAGMGWCQGRICGFAVSCITGGADPLPHAIETSLAQSAKRPAAQPLPLGVVADLD